MTRNKPLPLGTSYRVYGVETPAKGRSACARGHLWTEETTRWRVRLDKGETFPTRDCLTCKAEDKTTARQRKRSLKE